MRSNNKNFEFFNESDSQALILVVKIEFATPVYLTSHIGIPSIPSGAFEGVLSGVSSVSAKLCTICIPWYCCRCSTQLWA